MKIFRLVNSKHSKSTGVRIGLFGKKIYFNFKDFIGLKKVPKSKTFFELFNVNIFSNFLFVHTKIKYFIKELFFQAYFSKNCLVLFLFFKRPVL